MQRRFTMSTHEELDDDVSVVHQTLSREVNEEISDVSARLRITESETMDAICECVHAGCTDLIPIPVPEYEQVRRFPTHFFMRAGHEVSESERIVGVNDGYVVVEKLGGDGSYAASSDPRRRRSRRRR
jgi:hypothetical protein